LNARFRDLLRERIRSLEMKHSRILKRAALDDAWGGAIMRTP